ncbi:MAG TPA: cupin domain-containing protein [Acidimicrobiales bacterium]|nr:cupin domain-containing protein [Acidimicrobiales bacterium]
MEHVSGRQPGAKSATTNDTFVGSVWRDPVLTAEGVNISTIIFQPGAHTFWHSHSNGQILFIDHGRGVVVTRAGEVRSLGAADVLYASPGEEHWHGALPHSYLGQTTVSMGSTDWLEAVDTAAYEEAARQLES